MTLNTALGQYAGETDIVANVLVENISMNNAENGARIKVFGGNPDPNSVSVDCWYFGRGIWYVVGTSREQVGGIVSERRFS